jgi:hypothetical protein
VAIYLQSVMNNAKTFGLVKTASAEVAFYQKINLFAHEPTQTPAVCIVQGAATRKFGLYTKNRNEPSVWEDVVSFAVAYGLRQQSYCHMAAAMMAVLMFGNICRYNDASGLQWQNVRFLEDRSGYTFNFDKCKNTQYRQGNKVIFACLYSALGYMSGAVDARIEGAHRRIGRHVCLPRLYRPSSLENTGKDCVGTGADQV